MHVLHLYFTLYIFSVLQQLSAEGQRFQKQPCSVSKRFCYIKFHIRGYIKKKYIYIHIYYNIVTTTVATFETTLEMV